MCESIDKCFLTDSPFTPTPFLYPYNIPSYIFSYFVLGTKDAVRYFEKNVEQLLVFFVLAKKDAVRYFKKNVNHCLVYF